jgi:hypothetical protein
MFVIKKSKGNTSLIIFQNVQQKIFKNCILLPKGINEFVVFLRIVRVWF